MAVAAISLAGVACGSALVVTAVIFLHLRSPAVLGSYLLLGLVAAILSLILASLAFRRIRNSNGTLGGGKLILTSRILVISVFVWALLAPIMTPRPHHGGRRSIDASNLRQIGQASLIYANDHREVLPPAVISKNGEKRTATLHDVARLLALGGGLNDASLWFSNQDNALSREARRLQTTVLDSDRKGLNPEFAEQRVFSYDYVTGLRLGMRSTTPIAWTRGLRADGTWDPDGVYGTEGGHIVFLGGYVNFYRNLNGDSRLVGRDGERTSNILDTLPPGTRIVGGGPASLNGYFKPAEPKPVEPKPVQAKPVPRYYLPPVRTVRSNREIVASNFRAIGHASRTYSRQNGGNYPPAVISNENGVRPTTIFDVAVLLAAYGDLSDAQVWFFPYDLTLSSATKSLTRVWNPETGQMDRHFAAQEILSIDYLTGLSAEAPATTPIAWTRGLQENGQWDPEGAGGNDGGHILFLDGHVSYYDTLGSKTVRLTALDGRPTSNILDTLPPGTRIVGTGPATLGGTTISE